MKIVTTSHEGIGMSRRYILADTVEYCLHKLLTADQRKGLKISLFVSASRVVYRDARGCLEVTGETPYPKKFALQIAGRHRLITCVRDIAHESVHIKQHRLGELRHDAEDHDFMWWQGVRWPVDKHRAMKGSPSSWEDYYNRPWEIEAFGSERGLALNFLFDRHQKLYQQAIKAW